MSATLVQVLVVKPVLGRAIAPSDDTAPGANPVVMLSNAYWKKRFGASPAVLGRKILVNAHPMVIIGVVPPTFRGMIIGNLPDLFVPIAMKRGITPTWFALVARRT